MSVSVFVLCPVPETLLSNGIDELLGEIRIIPGVNNPIQIISRCRLDESFTGCRHTNRFVLPVCSPYEFNDVRIELIGEI